jgi:hypothetical protein
MSYLKVAEHSVKRQIYPNLSSWAVNQRICLWSVTAVGFPEPENRRICKTLKILVLQSNSSSPVKYGSIIQMILAWEGNKRREGAENTVKMTLFDLTVSPTLPHNEYISLGYPYLPAMLVKCLAIVKCLEIDSKQTNILMNIQTCLWILIILTANQSLSGGG